MAIPLYLAQTKAEITAATKLPEHMAWMACHFSPYGTGLTNVPKSLPKRSLLILNDRTPICGHDAKYISETLLEVTQQLDCCGILLDFQRPDCSQAAEIAAEVAKLSCPVVISDLYAKDLPCAVFLSPPALYQPLKTHLDSWQNRTVWIEAAMECAQITVTEFGSTYTPLPYSPPPETAYFEEALHCHYCIAQSETAVTFYLYRTRSDLASLLQEAESLGISCAVGLYQQLG